MDYEKERSERAERIRKGGAEKYHQSNQEKGKLFVRERLARLFDDDIELEDAFFAECMSDGLPADGVVTAIGKIGGQTVCVMANDSTVKAGSWGAKNRRKNHQNSRNSRKIKLPAHLFSRFGWRKNHRPNQCISRETWCRKNFLQSSQIIGTHSANLPAFRTVCGRGRLYSGLL